MPARRSLLLALLDLACIAALLGGAGCGGGGSSGGGPAVTVTLDVSAATYTALTSHAFAATVSGAGNTAVAWSVQEGAAGGSVDGAGTYTAPASPGTYHVVATSAADASARAVATVTVVAAPAITAFGAAASELLAGQSTTLTATFANGTGTIDHGVGAVTSGVPAPTGALSASQVYVLTVTNAAGTSVSSGLAVAVDGAVAVGVFPARATVEQGTSLAFGAVVGGAANTAVTWSVQEPGGGGVSAAGLYTPPARGGTFHVVATSAMDPSRSAAAEVTVPRAWGPAQVSGVVGWNLLKVASNAGGQAAVLAYLSHTENGTNKDELDLFLYSSSGGWGSQYVVAVGQNTGSDGILSPDLCMDGAGNVTVAWAYELSGSPGAFIPYTRRFTASSATWGLPTGMDSTSYRSSGIRVGCTPAGATSAAWKRFLVGSGTYQICVDTFPAGGAGWAALSTLGPAGPDPGLSPAIVPTAAGPVFLVYGAFGSWRLDSTAGNYFGDFFTSADTLQPQSLVARADALGNGTAAFDVADLNHPAARGVYVGELGNSGALHQSTFMLPGSGGFSVVDLQEQDDGAALLILRSDREAYRTALAASVRQGLVWAPLAPLGAITSATAVAPPAMVGAAMDGLGGAVAVWGAGPSTSTLYGSAWGGGTWSPARPLPKGSPGAILSNLLVTQVGGVPTAIWEETGWWTTSQFK